MTCARTVSGVGAAAQTAESIALSSQVGSASWVTTAEMGAIEAKVFLFAAFAPHPLHACKGSVRFGGGAGGRNRRRGTCSSNGSLGGTVHWTVPFAAQPARGTPRRTGVLPYRAIRYLRPQRFPAKYPVRAGSPLCRGPSPGRCRPARSPRCDGTPRAC